MRRHRCKLTQDLLVGVGADQPHFDIYSNHAVRGDDHRIQIEFHDLRYFDCKRPDPKDQVLHRGEIRGW